MQPARPVSTPIVLQSLHTGGILSNMEMSISTTARCQKALSLASRREREWIRVCCAERTIYWVLVVLLLTAFGQLIDSPPCPLTIGVSRSTNVSEDTDFSAFVAIPPSVHASDSSTPAPALPVHLWHIHGQHVMLLVVITLIPLLIMLARCYAYHPQLTSAHHAPTLPPPRLAYR